MNHQLQIQDLTVSYHRIPAIHHLNVSLACHSCVALLGPNGAGKTTLLKAIAGLLPLETGRIHFRGHSLEGKGKTLAYVPQREAVDWDFPITVRGLVELGRYPCLGLWRRFGDEDARIVEEALGKMELLPFAERQIRALSGGQQQRAFLARAWAQQADIYLLDEPFTGLDRNARDYLTHALHALRAEGKLIIASHHGLEEAREIFDTAVLLNGELVDAGPANAVLTEENLHKAYSVGVFSGDAS